MQEQEYQTVKEAARILRLRENQIYYAIKNKIIVPEKEPTANKQGKGYVYKISQADREKLSEAFQSVVVRTITAIDDANMLPPCHVCGHFFATAEEHTVQRFLEKGTYAWYPVCKNGVCNLSQKQVNEITKLKTDNADLKIKNARMARELAKIRQQITTCLIREGYESSEE